MTTAELSQKHAETCKRRSSCVCLCLTCCPNDRFALGVYGHSGCCGCKRCRIKLTSYLRHISATDLSRSWELHTIDR